MITKALHRFERFSAPKVGLVMLTLLLVLGVALFRKTQIETALTPGDDITVTFARDYQLRGYVTKVKIAGVPVGLVTGVSNQPGGTTTATLHLDKGVVRRLGDEPSAAIRPTTLLGGNYYVELTPGGDPGSASAIPASRTTVPVELDRVLDTLQPTARLSTQRTLRELDATFDKRGSAAVRGLVTKAPSTLRPLGRTLAALRGQDPSDLGALIANLETTARALSDENGQVDESVVGLAKVSRTLADTAPAISATVRDLPGTLRTTRSGLGALSRSLDQLKSVSGAELPTANQLSTTLTALEPALRDLKPVVRNLRPALRDLRPTIRALVPSALDGTTVVNDVKGRPIQRINGPVISALNSSWHGSGPYAKGGDDTVMYKEIAYMIAGMDNAGRMTDHNGSTIHFQPGFGIGSLSGTPISFEQLLMRLAYPNGAS
ncbi:MAG TPA: MlaD family protein [Nocardioides sp.]|nr:MlaD family protein [Nocardioides sp.]